VSGAKPLPREIAPGVYWIGRCYEVPFEGRFTHAYNSGYLVIGERSSALVETGIPFDVRVMLDQLDELQQKRPFPDPIHVFVSHSEVAHAGGVGLLLDRFPDATAHGDVSDLHLVFPQFADRMHVADPGERFDLGGTEIQVVEGVFRDLVHTRWFFDTSRRVLFPGDGFAYSHYHDDGACGCFAEEVPEIDLVGNVARFAYAAFHWTKYVDVEPYIERMEQLVFEELGANVIAGTHGLPIGDPAATFPTIREGFRAMRDFVPVLPNSAPSGSS
jgi:flavorubredoxin